MNFLRRNILINSLTAAGLLALAENGFAQDRPTSLSRPMRLISIGGALTEIIYLLNASKELVGVDTTSIYPAAAIQLPNVGYARSLSSEGILALRPTQVITTQDAGPPAVLRQISNAGIPLAVLPSNYQFQGVIDRVNQIGDLIYQPRRAQDLAYQLNLEWKKTQQLVANSKTKNISVLFILSQNPSQLMVAGQKTSADAVITYAGAKNAISGFSGYKPLTPEAVITANPDVILMTAQGIKAVGGIAGVVSLPGLDKTIAGRQKRIVSLETMYMLGFGPRMPLAIAELNTLLQQTMA
ncbi:hemin ABC transporter substrate-binding protein [Polynucleobacter sp. CS-Odin-A6]|uniref:heme/hemin ABC transporter substrate-binding protein n=1 Tax=Polynucleobacter sp. CS-Odin-A6 TaxID=2689106 RepID=UPI001C0DE073|nr:hemin ABC transporter substrate-binding protein [Polynucleobacter sp. CS-Odin-A6]MBU3621548.1 hemin ABC transporter substrate-binding protein [Polynucleobacter sp. CS-Odin-A6]